MADGLSNAEIAAKLYVSVITVKKHLTAIYRKYGAANRAQFTKAYMAAWHTNKLVPPG
ncbi:response regulator transcription factor [Gordoniibacillus kamchatkensis]|uniref:response regulator transcription factor n=1 Tax=Gordoniibacillus kamchatkensis TaxID=1590651 RepID=UPI0009E4853C